VAYWVSIIQITDMDQIMQGVMTSILREEEKRISEAE
jgi:hypothetical protein